MTNKFKVGEIAYHKMGFTPILIIEDNYVKHDKNCYEGRLYTMESYTFFEEELLNAKEVESKRKEQEKLKAEKDKKLIAKLSKK